MRINCVFHRSGSQTFFKIAWNAWNFIKKGLQRRCFSVNFATFLRTPFSGGCFCRQTDQKKQKHILKDILRVFLNIITQRTEAIIKFNEKFFWSWNIIILKLWKTRLEKRCPWAFYLVIAERYSLEHITVLKSDCRFTNGLVWRFKKLRASVWEKKN